MAIFINIVKLLGGLAMFLYGMEIMGDGLKQSTGTALKNVLGKLTNNILLGVLTGALVTAVIQSSTATIVLTVGLIGAGILNFRQAVGIVMGANIGTTVTAQIISLMAIDAKDSILALFKPDTLAPIALVIGIFLFMFIKKEKSKNIGLIAIGFGVLFVGLNSMTDATGFLTEGDTFANILAYFTDMPVVGIFTGLIMTVIVQSSSAMVGILQVLAETDGVNMSFNVVYPIIMGINLGTCVTTAMVCSIGTNNEAKRTGVVHIVFNTIGTVLFMIVMSVLKYLGFFEGLWNMGADSVVIANFQTLFNLITAIVLIPFTGLLVKIACAIVKDKKEEKEDLYPELAVLDKKLMMAPALALGEVNKLAVNMANIAKENIALSVEQFKQYDPKRTEEISINETRLDFITDSVDNYLIEMTSNIENERDNRHRNVLMQSVRDIERISDYSENLDEMAKQMSDSEIEFSKSAQQELDILSDAVQEILRLTVEALETDNEYIVKRIEPLEEVIDDMVLLLKDRHTARLCEGICSINSGLIFMDILTYFERAADQCSSIAMLILGKNNEDIMKNHHLYIQELHMSEDQSYVAEHANRKEQYLVPLQNIEY